MADSDNTPVSIGVDEELADGWSLDPGIFGRFSEHLGSVMYPGVYEEYLKNGSFEAWNDSGWDRGTGIIFPEVPRYDDVAYPWEPVVRRGNPAFERRSGGVHGRRTDSDIEDGVGVPDRFELEPADAPELGYQRIDLDGEGGVKQRVALPDFRTSGFELSVSVRGVGSSDCTVALTPVSDAGALAEETIPVSGEWERHTVELALEAESPDRYRESRYGAFWLVLIAEGDGRLDVDWATLIPTDAVEGKFNPMTIDLLQEFGVSNVRWPGGNFASQYRWRDGVGPVEERPVKPILNWSGLEPNSLGTNEFLRFCELADVEPYITVPFWDATGPEEAAKWVEYVNGSTDTEMGALRAEHGYPDPWDVTWWGVGNEVWGWFQVGGTDAATYAREYPAYHEAMRAVDPDIEIDASGVGLADRKYHDGSRGQHDVIRENDLPVWNDILLETVGDRLEGLDVHRYSWGIGRTDDEAEKREDWLEANDEDPTGYAEVNVNFPAVWERLIADLRTRASEQGASDLRITAGEWDLALGVGEGWPDPKLGTMAHAIYATRTFLAFLRQGEAIRLGHWTQFTLFPHPRPDGTLPPSPGDHVQREIADPIRSTDGEWHLIETTVRESPTRPFPETGRETPAADDVALVDAVTIGTPGDEGVRLQTIVVNGSLEESATVRVEYPESLGVEPLVETSFRGAEGDPFRVQESWDERDGFEVVSSEVGLSEGTATVSLPPCSVSILRSDRPADHTT